MAIWSNSRRLAILVASSIALCAIAGRTALALRGHGDGQGRTSHSSSTPTSPVTVSDFPATAGALDDSGAANRRDLSACGITSMLKKKPEARRLFANLNSNVGFEEDDPASGGTSCEVGVVDALDANLKAPAARLRLTIMGPDTINQYAHLPVTESREVFSGCTLSTNTGDSLISVFGACSTAYAFALQVTPSQSAAARIDNSDLLKMAHDVINFSTP